MGSVYEAHDPASSQRVAIKVLHKALQRHPVIPKRFVQEAMAARALTTPFAVKVEGTGNLADGCPFIVMEFLDGVDLGTLARQLGGKLAVDRVVRLADQVASALEEAHARGIVHRDLKPENIFVLQTPQGEMIKVVDFGISKILTREDGIRLTQTGTTLGTPQYMPMEQLRGVRDLDGRVDVYALGVMLYEILAGVRPYDGFTYEEVIVKVATTTPPPLSTYRGDLPPALVEMVDRAMQRERETRLGSMTELRQILATLHGQAPISTPVGVPVTPSTNYAPVGPKGTEPLVQADPRLTPMPPAVADRSSMTSARSARKSSAVLPLVLFVLLIGGAGLLLTVGGAGIWYYLTSSAEPEAVQLPSKGQPAGTTSKMKGRAQTK